MLPSSLFKSLDDDAIAAIGDRLDAEIEATVAEVCELLQSDAQENMTAEDDRDREHERDRGIRRCRRESTRLQQAASQMAEAQAWEGQKIAKGWRQVVNALPGTSESVNRLDDHDICKSGVPKIATNAPKGPATSTS